MHVTDLLLSSYTQRLSFHSYIHIHIHIQIHIPAKAQTDELSRL